MPNYTRRGIAYPTPYDLIKSGNMPSKLASDLQSQAATTDYAIGVEGVRAQVEATAAATSSATRDATRAATRDATAAAINDANTRYGDLPGRIADTQNDVDQQAQILAGHETRISAVETLGGLAPGDTSDATMANVLANPATQSGAALRETFELRSVNNTKNYEGTPQQRLEQALADDGVVQFDETVTHDGNITGFWLTTIFGTGVIHLPDGSTFTPDPKPVSGQTITNTVYVHAQNGNDSNDGLTPETAFRSVMGMYNRVLRRLTAQQAAQARWVVRLSGQFTTAHRFSELPDFPKGLVFQGEPPVDGENQTSFTRVDGTHHICFWIEPGADNVEFYNIHFQDYTSDGTVSNGYAVLMKLGGRLVVRDCSSDNCDTGFAAIQNVNFSIHDNATTGGVWGIKAQYNSSGAFNRNHISGASQYGVHVTRNTVAHFDYNTVENCGIAGAQVEMASRAALVENTFRNNPTGVLVQGAAEWINNDNIFLHNGVNYAHNGVGRENRMHSQGLGASNEFRIHSTLAAAAYTEGMTVDHPGGSNRVTVFSGASAGRIPGGWFGDPTKRLRFEVVGRIISNGSSHGAVVDIGAVDRDGSNWASTAVAPLGSTLDGDFRAEMFVVPSSFSSQRRERITTTVQGVFFSAGFGTVDFSTERTLRLTVRGASGGAPFTAEIFYMNVYAIG